jgi:hypothetical protein
VDADPKRYAGPEHQRCNRATSRHRAQRRASNKVVVRGKVVIRGAAVPPTGGQPEDVARVDECGRRYVPHPDGRMVIAGQWSRHWFGTDRDCWQRGEACVSALEWAAGLGMPL